MTRMIRHFLRLLNSIRVAKLQVIDKTNFSRIEVKGHLQTMHDFVYVIVNTETFLCKTIKFTIYQNTLSYSQQRL